MNPSAAVAELKRLLTEAGIDRDDPLFLRLADIEIKANAFLLKPDNGTPPAVIDRLHELVGISLEQQLAHLARDFLGWYLLPDEPAGNNEAPVGPAYVAVLRQRLRQAGQYDETRIMHLRDEVATFLSQRAGVATP